MIDTTWRKYSESKPTKDTEVLTYCSEFGIRELIFSDLIDDYTNSIWWQYLTLPEGFEE